jgi:uncharacterized protein (DUF427 family)
LREPAETRFVQQDIQGTTLARAWARWSARFGFFCSLESKTFANEDDEMKATWRGTTVAESTDTVIVEGNHYFPADSIKLEHFKESETHTVCSWKGTAHYYDVVVAGEVNKDAAWYYPDPKDAAASIKNRIAFWKGVAVE